MLGMSMVKKGEIVDVYAIWIVYQMIFDILSFNIMSFWGLIKTQVLLYLVD